MGDHNTSIDELFRELESDDTSSVSSMRKKGSRKKFWIILGSLVALVALVAGASYALLAKSFNEIERVSIAADANLERPEPPVIPKGENAPINILLLGSDSRDESDPNISANDLRGFRSDSIMVAQLSADRKHVTVMSIMRDNWVEIQGHGEAKINAAVAYGGIPLAVNTVENFIGARIDHVALIDFESFQGLTEAVGGVTVHNPMAFTAQHSGKRFNEGEVTLNGVDALSYVRERYAFTDGDYQRARNQQAYLQGLTTKVLSKETFTSPERIISLFNSVKPYLILDDGFDLSTAIKLGIDMKDLRSDDIVFFTSPTLGTGTSADGQSIVLPHEEELRSLREAMSEGNLNEYAKDLQPGSELPE